MAVHLFLMNALAPFAALAVRRLGTPGAAPNVFPAMIGQLGLLWMWHAPPLLAHALRSSAVHLLMQLSLFAAALWFWAAVLSLRGSARWRGLLALTLTAKLFCLLGVLLVFAPRFLYPELSSPHAAGHVMAASLADQQLAGLLMLVVCPASYLAAGVAIAARWVFETDGSSWSGRESEERRDAAARNAA